jgi:hypothetical protein
MRQLDLNSKAKAWLTGLLVVLAVNLAVFLARNRLNPYFVFGVVLLTPVAWLLITLLFRHLSPKNR